MRIPLATLLASLALAAGACRNQGTVLVPAQPGNGPRSNPPPSAPDLRVMPPLAGDLYGIYALRRVGGSALPASLGTEGGCAVLVVAGTLSLERDRFTWTETRQRACPTGRTTQPVRAAGGFTVTESTLRLAADSGAFATGVGVFLGHGELQVDALEGGGASGGPAVRRYVKHDVAPREH